MRIIKKYLGLLLAALPFLVIVYTWATSPQIFWIALNVVSVLAVMVSVFIVGVVLWAKNN